MYTFNSRKYQKCFTSSKMTVLYRKKNVNTLRKNLVLFYVEHDTSEALGSDATTEL